MRRSAVSMPRRRSTRRASIHAVALRPCNLQNWRGLRTISLRLPDHLCYSLAGFSTCNPCVSARVCGWRFLSPVPAGRQVDKTDAAPRRSTPVLPARAALRTWTLSCDRIVQVEVLRGSTGFYQVLLGSFEVLLSSFDPVQEGSARFLGSRVCSERTPQNP